MEYREDLKNRKQELQRQLGDPEVFRDPQKVKELSMEFSRIEKKLKELSREGPADSSQNVIMEIRAGTGGEEAALFAKKLFSMYSRFAEKMGWQTTLLDESKSGLNGYKEVIFEINGKNAYPMLQEESGVHRVQRIPETEKSGRIHTSTVSVAVLPEPRETDVHIAPQDIKVEFFRSSGPGGQNVNKVETAVRISHLPTGIVVSSQESRSQQKNRDQAMRILRARLLEEERGKQTQKREETRREQIGTAQRPEKIRTYNFPQDRVTDHRIKQSWHHLEGIMEGNLEPIMEELKKKAQ